MRPHSVLLAIIATFAVGIPQANAQGRQENPPGAVTAPLPPGGANPAPPAARPEKPVQVAENPYYYVDLRDAPFVEVVDQLCQAARVDVDYEGVSHDDPVTVTARIGGGSIEDVLARVVRAASVPLEWQRFRDGDAVHYRVKLKKGAKLPPEEPYADGPAPTSLEAVPRRVAGVFRSKTEYSALLVTGIGRGATRVFVKVGDRTLSRFPGAQTLKVDKITARGVTLATPDGKQTVFVPVRRINGPAETPDAKPEAKPENKSVR